LFFSQLLPTLREEAEEDDDDGPLVTRFGWVVASNPLGQMVFSPILGYVSNRMGKIGPACMFTSVTYMIGNALYSILSIFPEDARYPLLMLSRFTIGASAANAAPMRAYVSSATFQHERTFHMSILSAAQSLGMIVGPSVQAALTPIKCSDRAVNAGPDDTYLAFDMYTASGWVSVLMGAAMLFLFSPMVFDEVDVAKEERERTLAKFSALSGKLPDPDYLFLWMSIISFFIYYFNFVIIET